MQQAKKNSLFWIFVLSGAVYFTQGIEALPSQGLFYYLKETLHYPPEKIMLLSSVTIAAWVIKPVIGYIIDNFLSKTAWIFLALGIDILLVSVLGIFGLPIAVLIIVLVLNSTDSAFRDVAVDGIMCVEGKKFQATGKIQSIQWISISASGILTGVGGGYIAEKWGYKAGFLCLIPFYLLTACAAYAYNKTNGPGSRSARTKLDADLKRLLMDKRLIIVAIFIFLYKYSPSFGTPLFFIKRDSFKWSKLWIGGLATLGTCFEIAGAILYYKFSQKIKIKKWLYYSVFIGAVTTLSYLYYTPASAIIYDIVYGFIGMFIYIMVLDFMARNTIAGLETTSFALLCSVSNLALVASNVSGAYLLAKIGLPWLILISATTSFLCLPLIKKIE